VIAESSYSAPSRPSGFFTVTRARPSWFGVPSGEAGVVQLIEVAPLHVTFVAATPPTSTTAPALNPVPVTVTAVPPPTGPP